ncbi:MAG: carboxymuconolactone decarboxylase family protein [Pseudobdellovibrionaceae bacterium]
MSQSINEKVESFLMQEFGDHQTSIFRDLMMNFRKIMEESPLPEMDRFLNLLAIATTLENEGAMELAEHHLKTLDATQEQILEAKEVAAIMGMMNTYYKFRGYLAPEAAPNFQRAGLRMQSLMKPQNGKERFEMMAFSVSVVNGCPSCVGSHERALAGLGVESEKIHDLARLASVLKGLTALRTAHGK